MDGEYRLSVRGEAPTTVEAPFEDVTRGVLNAVQEAQELRGRELLDGERILTPQSGDRGVDTYLSTSSAGGGLQMMVSGVVKTMTAESAQRAALGAGAIVMDVMATNDGRKPHERIARLRALRPDMILMAGGTDGGDVKHVVEMAELVAAAAPRPRLGHSYRLPIIFAGNRDAQEHVRKSLEAGAELHLVENIRPDMNTENLMPARLEIQDLFMLHVMQQAPGYDKLSSWTDSPIMPTPAAVGSMMQTVARREGINVVGVDIGGATTDVFSVFGGVFNRTVSANLGMSYSVSNVLVDAGPENVLRWLPFSLPSQVLSDRIRNKMIRPTTIPQTLEDLIIEQAIAREALRLAFEQHKSLAVGLKGIQQQRTIDQAFEQTLTGETLVDMMALDLIIGSGGVLSHAPRRQQSALMMIDAFMPEGVTRLAVDSIFMMPQLGVLAAVHEEAAMQVFWRDCLIPLGTCIAPRGSAKPGDRCLTVELNGTAHDIAFGDVLRLELPEGRTATARIAPARGFDVGPGRGEKREALVHGGVVGLIIDCRGRPLSLPASAEARTAALTRLYRCLDIYPG